MGLRFGDTSSLFFLIMVATGPGGLLRLLKRAGLGCNDTLEVLLLLDPVLVVGLAMAGPVDDC